MPYAVRLNIMVGIGGTGRDAVLKVKRKLKQVYGEIPPTVKFLVIDTTDLTTMQYQDKDIRLDGREFLSIQMYDPIELLRKPDIKAWYPERVPVKTAIDGASQVRAVGRMALFANDSRVLPAISKVMEDVRSFDVGRLENDKYELISKRVVVNIVCSLGGGTGSGTFIDVAYLFRYAGAIKPDYKIAGYFLMPTVFTKHPFTRNVEPNCYAALKELDYHMNLQLQDDRAKYKFGERMISRQYPPYDVVYLVDNVNKEGTAYSEIEDLTEFLSTGLFISCGTVAKNTNDSLDNAESQILGMKSIHGKKAQYCSFGISEVIFNKNAISMLLQRELALKLVNAFSIPTKLDPQKEVETFINLMGLREDRNYDKVIDAILQPSNLRSFEMPEKKKGAVQKIVDIKTTYLNRVEEEAVVTANKNYELMLPAKIKAIREEIIKQLHSDRGLSHTKKFVDLLLGRIGAFKEMLIYERNDIEEQRKRTQAKYDLLLDDIKKAEAKIFGFGKAIQEACMNYQRNALNEATQIREKKRRERAIDVFENLQEELRAWRQRIIDIDSHLSKLTESLSAAIGKMRHKKMEIKPFVIELEQYLMEKIQTGEINLNDFLKWSRDRGRSVAHWSDMRTDEVEMQILEYCNGLSPVQQISSSNIESELQRLSEEMRIRLLKQLDEMAVPLWQYSSAHIRGSSPEILYTFGVTDQEKTIMTDSNTLRKMKGTLHTPTHVSTNDPNRIIFFKAEVAIPVFAISRMERFREEYLDENAPFNFHTDRNLEPHLPDLFPEMEDTQGRLYWSVGLCPEELGIGLIRRDGTHFYARSQKFGKAVDNYMISLDQGRSQAMKKFLSNSELVAEMKNMIEGQVRQVGNAAMVENLRKYREKLLTDAQKAGEEMKKQLEWEIRDVETFRSMLE